jgi:hypothetical protein
MTEKEKIKELLTKLEAEMPEETTLDHKCEECSLDGNCPLQPAQKQTNQKTQATDMSSADSLAKAQAILDADQSFILFAGLGQPMVHIIRHQAKFTQVINSLLNFLEHEGAPEALLQQVANHILLRKMTGGQL